VTKTYIIVALVSYLLGSIPFGYILVKLFLKQDIRTTGSGNIGATNVARSGAKGLAIATLLLDAMKGFAAVVLVSLPVFAFRSSRVYIVGNMERDHAWLLASALAALAAIVGHMFPIWLKFKGGKGVATGVGAFAALAPAAIGVTLVLFAIIVALTRYVSLGSIVASAAFPILAHFVSGYSALPLTLMGTSSLLIILKHHENIRRLLAGTETKFGGKKSVPPPEAMEKQA
jgi:acyl phosphate:glycerol-3-phosphate acyltransferase